MKLGDVLIVIGAILIAFVLAGFVVDRNGFGRIPSNDGFVFVIAFVVGVGFLASGLLSNYRRSN